MLGEHTSSTIPREHIVAMARNMDLNKDGRIDFNEFLETFRIVDQFGRELNDVTRRPSDEDVDDVGGGASATTSPRSAQPTPARRPDNYEGDTAAAGGGEARAAGARITHTSSSGRSHSRSSNRSVTHARGSNGQSHHHHQHHQQQQQGHQPDSDAAEDGGCTPNRT